MKGKIEKTDRSVKQPNIFWCFKEYYTKFDKGKETKETTDIFIWICYINCQILFHRELSSTFVVPDKFFYAQDSDSVCNIQFQAFLQRNQKR